MDYVIINVTGGKIELENVGHYHRDDKVGGVIWKTPARSTSCAISASLSEHPVELKPEITP